MTKRRSSWILLALMFGLLIALNIAYTAADAAHDFGTNWTAQYYSNPDLQGAPVFTETLPNGINFNWGTNPPNPATPATYWSARFTSVQNFNQGQYIFSATSDDGVRVYVDNVLVLDQWIGRTLTTDQFTLNMTQGPHTLQVDYFNGIDQAALQFQWFQISGGITTTPIFPGGGGPTATFGPTPTATRIPPTPLPPIPPGALTGTVIRASVLLVRQQPFLGAPVVGRILRGQTYQIIGRNQEATWFLLQLSTTQGWAWGYYLGFNSNEFNAPVVSPFQTSGDPAYTTGVVMQAVAGLRLRAAPNTASEQIGRIQWGSIMPVLGRSADGGWYQTQYLGTIGWVAAPYVQIVQGDVNTVPVTG